MCLTMTVEIRKSAKNICEQATTAGNQLEAWLIDLQRPCVEIAEMIEKGVCSVTARKWMTKGKNAGLKC